MSRLIKIYFSVLALIMMFAALIVHEPVGVQVLFGGAIIILLMGILLELPEEVSK
ncbi:MAG: hypothetical protein ACYTFW_16920 [Planctomycetota bacterium]|jgi:hypothetical protein